MPEPTPNQETITLLEKTLKKYKIFFFSAVGLLIIGVLLFTNYDAGSKLKGYIGPTAEQQATQTSLPALTKPIVTSITSPLEGGTVTLSQGDPSLKFAWEAGITNPNKDITQLQPDTPKAGVSIPTLSYEWAIKQGNILIWEVNLAYTGGIASEDSQCNVQLITSVTHVPLTSGKDWICKYVTLPGDIVSKLVKNTAYTFEVYAYDGKNFSDAKKINFKTVSKETPPCTEGAKTSDGVLTCKNGKWETTPVVVDNANDESVPSLIPKTAQTMTEGSGIKPVEEEVVPELVPKTVTPPKDETKTVVPPPKNDLTLTKVKLSSKEFNPLLKSVTFTIETSADAKIDIKIYDKKGDVVASPVSDKAMTGGKEATIDWEGDNDKKKTLSAGTYSYKVFAKDPTSKETKDTKTGDVMLKYGTTVIKDPEDITGKTSGSTSVVPSKTTQAVSNPSTSNSAATVALQNSKEGKTAGTGPETIIYLIFPILGYTVGRKFK